MNKLVWCWVTIFLSGSLLAADAKISEPLPSIKVEAAQGELDFADYRGKVILLDFWASWCGPCRQSFPWMNDVQARYADEGLTVIAVNLDQNRADAQAFLSEVPASFQIAYDASGHSAEMMHVVGMPMSYLIDRQGRVRQSLIGFNQQNKAEHETQIRELLAERVFTK